MCFSTLLELLAFWHFSSKFDSKTIYNSQGRKSSQHQQQTEFRRLNSLQNILCLKVLRYRSSWTPTCMFLTSRIPRIQHWSRSWWKNSNRKEFSMRSAANAWVKLTQRYFGPQAVKSLHLRLKPFDFSRLIKTLGFELKALFQDIWENKAPIGSRQQTKLSFETCWENTSR